MSKIKKFLHDNFEVLFKIAVILDLFILSVNILILSLIVAHVI